MGPGTSSRRSPLTFILLVFALAIPVWLIAAVADRDSAILPFNLPVSALMFPCPLIAASILVYREDGPDGLRQLLTRPFDYRRIRQKSWYVPILFLIPVIYGLAYGAMRLMGRPLPDASIAVLVIPVLLVVFYVAAVGEEVGWSAYALDPMQGRWGALGAGLLLGTVWALWHVVPDIQAHRTLAWIVSQRSYSILLRILIVWIYNNTGRSVFAAALAHASDSVSYALFPNNGSHYDPAFIAPIAAIAVAIVTYLWGPRTLSRFRLALKPRPA